MDTALLPIDNADDNEDDEPCKGTSCRRGSKPHSTPLTLKWLEENYEIAEGVCIPRSTLYLHYLDNCQCHDTTPVNAASFGKIIRQQFPQITTRRLGTRGQSKYHYYGIGVRETSLYYDVIYSAKGPNASGDGKKEHPNKIIAYSPRSKLGTLLPPFPDVSDIKLPSGVDERKVVTFLMMYRTHSQRILDTVIRANFDEVQSFLLHFWQGMPAHIIPILSDDIVTRLVGVCDSVLYKAVEAVLMPTVLQALPDSLTQVIRTFAKQLDEWLSFALAGMPDGLKRMKLDLSRRFSQILRRQLSLNHLVQASRTVVNSPDVMGQMLSDWMNIDLDSIIKQTLYAMDHYTDLDRHALLTMSSEFERLLDEQAPLESYVEWLDTIIQNHVVKVSKDKLFNLNTIARQFLLMWTSFGTRIIRDMTLQSATSFGSFHLLHLMFDDYVLYTIESLHRDEMAHSFLQIVKGEATEGEDPEDILPNSSAVNLSYQAVMAAGQSSSRLKHSSNYSRGYAVHSFLDYDSPSDYMTTDEEADVDDDFGDDTDEEGEYEYDDIPFNFLGDLTDSRLSATHPLNDKPVHTSSTSSPFRSNPGYTCTRTTPSSHEQHGCHQLVDKTAATSSHPDTCYTSCSNPQAFSSQPHLPAITTANTDTNSNWPLLQSQQLINPLATSPHVNESSYCVPATTFNPLSPCSHPGIPMEQPRYQIVHNSTNQMSSPFPQKTLRHPVTNCTSSSDFAWSAYGNPSWHSLSSSFLYTENHTAKRCHDVMHSNDVSRNDHCSKRMLRDDLYDANVGQQPYVK